MTRLLPKCALALSLLASPPLSASETIELMGTLRDFKSRGSEGGHTDFQDTYNKSYPLITGMVKAALGENGKPALNTVAASTSVLVASSLKNLTQVKLVYQDDSTTTYGSLSVGQSATFSVPADKPGFNLKSVKVMISGSTSEYTIADDADHVNTASAGSNGTITATYTQSQIIPRQWRIASMDSFNQWFTNVEGVNQAVPHSITLTRDPETRVYRFEASKHNNQSFFPLDGQLYGNQTWAHNYHFTYEIHSKFTYTSPGTRDYALNFEFSGDDDVWVYINKKLVVDIGGVHGEKFASVNVDTLASSLGLEPGQTYDLDFYFAERHTTESNFTLETTIQFLPALYD
jgi:fibro-slime domain-containing protein